MTTVAVADDDDDVKGVSNGVSAVKGETTAQAADATTTTPSTSDATVTTTTTTNTHDARVARYIMETSAVQFQDSWSRLPCPICNASRYLYCPDCCEILIPHKDWPPCIVDGTLRLPFSGLHIILDDRRMCASGVQVATILRATAAAAAAARRQEEEEEKKWPVSCSLLDQALDEGIPNYQQQQDDGQEGTYLLFPDSTSVPLSSVVASSADGCSERRHLPLLKRLVVLDCKWTNSSLRLHPHLACLTKVHLDQPPSESYFWRWHSAGRGMLSTVEAIYYAAAQVAEQLQWNSEHQENLVHLLWLFGLQRQVIGRRFEQEKKKAMASCSSTSCPDTLQQPTTTCSSSATLNSTVIDYAHEKTLHLPFTENAKECARTLRTLQKHRKKKS